MKRTCLQCNRIFDTTESRNKCQRCRHPVGYHKERYNRKMSDPEFRKRKLQSKRLEAKRYYITGATKARIEQSPKTWLSRKLVLLQHRSQNRTGSMRYKFWRPLVCDINIDYLLNQWERQHGNCAISHLSLTTKIGCLQSASIDRINSDLGYIVGNVQLLSSAINMAKNKYGNNLFELWISEIRKPTRPQEQPQLLYLRRLLDGAVHRSRWYRHQRRKNELEIDISIQYLSDLWIMQNGKCALTGISMSNLKGTPFSASIDRINHVNGYTKNNIQLVSISANLAKNKHNITDIMKIINSIKFHNIPTGVVDQQP